jgi:multidrug resistance efflux pump
VHSKRPAKALFLIVAILLAGLLIGCGGGQSDDGSQGGGKEQDTAAGKKEQGATGKKKAPQAKIALGTIQKVTSRSSDKGKIVLRPTAEVQGGEPMNFIVSKEKATVELNDKEADLADIKEGQQAQIEYVVRKWGNQARKVQLFSAGEGLEGGEESG